MKYAQAVQKMTYDKQLKTPTVIDMCIPDEPSTHEKSTDSTPTKSNYEELYAAIEYIINTNAVTCNHPTLLAIENTEESIHNTNKENKKHVIAQAKRNCVQRNESMEKHLQRVMDAATTHSGGRNNTQERRKQSA